jgi:predicted nucleic acid-binding protein
MRPILLDANVLLDIWHSDPIWSVWSVNQIREQALHFDLAINLIIYSEISVSFATSAALDRHLSDLRITVLDIPLEAAFLAGRAHTDYRRKGGSKNNVLADFFIGAHAFILGSPLLTRDTRRYATYFPSVPLVAP